MEHAHIPVFIHSISEKNKHTGTCFENFFKTKSIPQLQVYTAAVLLIFFKIHRGFKVSRFMV